MDFDSIDWDALWRAEFAKGRWKDELCAKERWDKRASSYNKGVRRWDESPEEKEGDYISQMLHRIKVLPDWTVLDIGCGPGTLAIPIARKAKRVTGLDVSPQMLGFLRENALKSGLSNLDYVEAGWQDALAGDRLGPHDVVVASRSMMGAGIKDALAAMHALARQAVYLTIPVMHLSFDWEAYAAIGRDRRRHPPYIYVLNMLYQMGIRANLEMLHSKMRLEFNSVDAAVRQLSLRSEPFSDDELLKLRGYLEGLFASQTALPYVHHGRSIWALICWQKGDH